VLRWAKVWAARQDTSVSRLVGEMLAERMRREQGYQAAMESHLSGRPQPLRRPGEPLPSRDRTHERIR
jgi:hypothetical protein